MNKKRAAVLAIIAAVLLLCVGLYRMPKTFGKGVDPSRVQRIQVFDGQTGVGFTVDAPEDIRKIVENIQSIPMHRSGLSLGAMGYGLQITFVGENDRDTVPLFFLNSETTIRKDPFFYRCDGGLCFDELKALEAKAHKPGLGNPWRDWDSLAAAEESAGFAFGLPETVSETYTAQIFRTLDSEPGMLEVLYFDADFRVTVRKAPGEEPDISGVYGFAEEGSYEAANGVPYTVYRPSGASEEEPGVKILLQHKGFSWAIFAPDGFWGASCEDFVNAIAQS